MWIISDEEYAERDLSDAELLAMLANDASAGEQNNELAGAPRQPGPQQEGTQGPRRDRICDQIFEMRFEYTGQDD